MKVFALILLGIVLIIGLYVYIAKPNLYTLGYKIFTSYKFMKGSAVEYPALIAKEGPPISHQAWDDLLSTYVKQNGDVDYASWAKDRESLEAYLNLLQDHGPSHTWTRAEQMAYWINAYNAFTIEIILRHYPLSSIKDIGGNYTFVNSVWDLKFFKIAGQEMDLNTIEHRILRQEFGDPRIHFAINCASFSCPRLRNEAYTPERLEDQLEDQARYLINNPRKNRISEDRVELSMIFKWYEVDFEEELPLKAYINRYASLPLKEENDIEYIDYDWSLNEG